LVVLFLAVALAVGVEIGSISILTTFLMELHSFSQVTSKIGLIVFLGGMATGRLTLGFFTQNERIPRYVLTLFGLSFLFFTGLYSLNLGALTYITIFLAGISLSALLPLMIAWAGLLYPDAAGTVLGAIKVAAPLGGIVIPASISALSKLVSFRASLFVFPGACLLAFVIMFVEIRYYKISVSRLPVIR
jgi:fucose permease